VNYFQTGTANAIALALVTTVVQLAGAAETDSQKQGAAEQELTVQVGDRASDSIGTQIQNQRSRQHEYTILRGTRFLYSAPVHPLQCWVKFL
jgi:hypothetical protein